MKLTPRQDGFRMPAEFEEQKQIFLLWPERKDVWHHDAKKAQEVFIEVAHAIAQFEQVTVGVSDTHFDIAKEKLGANVRVVIMPHDDVWTRDVGPTFVINDKGETRGIDWKFNAWGGKEEGAYHQWDKDDNVASKILEIEKVKGYKTEDFILEGGSIHVDGEGTLLTTKECLLNSNRNPHLNQEQIERYLKEYLNVDTIIWLENGLFNDETDGHIDNICCFARPGEVILAWTDEKESPNYEICREAFKILEDAVDSKGRRLKIYKLYLPKPVFITEEEDAGIEHHEEAKSFSIDEPLPASYVNFLIINGAIIFPIFKDTKDELAIQTIKEIFPEREIIPIYSREIILGGGNIHCISQQQPK